MTTQSPPNPSLSTESDVATQLASINQRLANLETAQSNVTTVYSDSHSKYLKELEQYGRGRIISLALRIVSVAILVYIAYRVS
jgi:hypothetical protein